MREICGVINNYFQNNDIINPDKNELTIYYIDSDVVCNTVPELLHFSRRPQQVVEYVIHLGQGAAEVWSAQEHYSLGVESNGTGLGITAGQCCKPDSLGLETNKYHIYNMFTEG